MIGTGGHLKQRTARRSLGALLVGVATVALALCVAAPAAVACGVWSLEDGKRGRVQFLVHNVRLRNRLIFTVWGSSRLRSVDTNGRQVKSPRGHKTLYDFRGRSLRRRGRAVGTFDGGVLTIAGKRFAIEVTKGSRRCIDGAPCFNVTVKQGQETVARASRAFSFVRGCGGEPSTHMQQQREVAQRVALYLAWRSQRR